MQRLLQLVLIFFAVAPTVKITAYSTNIFGSYDKAAPFVFRDTSEYENLGKKNIQRKEWDEAIINFGKALQINPNDAFAYENRGDCYFAKQEMKNAINDFSQLIKINPTNSTAYYNRGTVLRAQRAYEKAIVDYNESLRLNPKNALAYESLASIYSLLGNYDKSIRNWNEGLRLNPTNSTALAFRGWDYFMTSQFDLSVNDYLNAIRLDPQNIMAYNNFAWLRATCPNKKMRNGNEAVKLATKACELDIWKRWSSIDTLAAAYGEAGDFEKAIEYQKQALSFNGGSESDHKKMKYRLSLFEQHQPYHEGQH